MSQLSQTSIIEAMYNPTYQAMLKQSGHFVRPENDRYHVVDVACALVSLLWPFDGRHS